MYKVHVLSLVTVEFLLFIEYIFTINAQSNLHESTNAWIRQIMDRPTVSKIPVRLRVVQQT